MPENKILQGFLFREIKKAPDWGLHIADCQYYYLSK